MTEVQTVRDTLLATAQVGAVISLCPVQTDIHDALRHIAMCVDRTILARRIQMSLSNGTDLMLDARNRRLLQFSLTRQSNHVPSNDLDLTDTICAPKDSAEVTQKLHSLMADCTIVQQRIVNDPTIKFPTKSGVSANAIWKCPDENLQPRGSTDLVTFLTDRVEDAPVEVLAACVLTAEGILAICGSDEQLLAMVDWASPVLENSSTHVRPLSSKLKSDSTCFINWGLPHPRRLLVANVAGQTALVLAENDKDSGFLSDLKDQLSLEEFTH